MRWSSLRHSAFKRARAEMAMRCVLVPDWLIMCSGGEECVGRVDREVRREVVVVKRTAASPPESGCMMESGGM